MEFELKYALGTAEAAEALLRDPFLTARFREPLREIAMETAYYDSPDLPLREKKWTLRLRRENGVSVAALKTPGGAAHARGEWETEAPDLLAALPALAALGAPAELLQIRTLTPFCGAKFRRRAVLLDADGCLCELALDEGVLFRGGETAPLLELELELKDGSREALLAFGETLRAKFSLREEPKSKFYRASRLNAE